MCESARACYGAAIMKIFATIALSIAASTAASADPVVDAFYLRCVSENAYQMASADLEQACGCMAPVLVSFLTDDAYSKVEQSIRTNTPVNLSGYPYRGDPAELARLAIAQCPAVGAAMYRQKCAGANETTPECREMKAMIDQNP